MSSPRLGIKLAFWMICAALSLLAAEIGARVWLYQEKSEHHFALLKVFNLVKEPREEFRAEKIGIWTPDPILGYRHKPGAVGHHLATHFDVTYTIDNKGNRAMETKTGARSLEILGGSFSFGHGVEDNETFVSILSNEYWPDVSISNRAVTAWGTAHAYLTMKNRDELQPLPDSVVYAMIPHHIERNYIRPSWVTGIASHGMRQPHFELKDGQLQSLGSISESSVPNEGLKKKEIDLTIKVLQEIQRFCQEEEVFFAIILLPTTKIQRWPPSLITGITRLQIPFLDLSKMKIQGFSKNEKHPNPQDHRLIAKAIATSFLAEKIR